MKLKDVHYFFEQLSRRVSVPVNVLVTGGAAAILFGVSRATEDIDFEVEVVVSPTQRHQAWQSLEQALGEVQKLTGITPQFSEDIDRWSSITLPSKRRRPLWKFSTVKVEVLDPLDWSVGKLARYLASDESDVVEVFKRQNVSPRGVAQTWGKALALSPASSAQTLFRNNVRSFFDKHARGLWGATPTPQQLFDIVLKAAHE